MKTSEFLKEMYNLYRQDRSNFIANQEAINLANKEYKIEGILNEERHFELLQSIMYKLYNQDKDINIDYLNFLQNLLFGIFEQNAISLIYKLESSNLRNILSAADRKFGPNIFYESGKGISISNTQIHKLIDKFIKIEKDKMYSTRRETKNSTSRRTSYKRTGEGKRKKNKKDKKSRKKKYKKKILNTYI